MAIEQHGIAVSIEAQLDKFRKEMQDSGGLVEVVTTGMDRATKRAATSFNRLQARIDPATRAFRQYEQRVSQVRLAVESGAATQQEAENVLEGLKDQYEQVREKLASMGEASAANDNEVRHSTSTYRKFGAVAQQAGYQVGDFAVQIASGQNALVAFTQQGAQLLGVFGPWGAVLGAAVAVVGALAVAFWDSNEAASDAATSVERYKESVKDAEAFIKRLNDETKTQTQLLRDERAEILKTAQERVKAAIADLEQRKARVEAMNKKSNDLGFGIENEEVDTESYQRFVDEIAKRKKQLDDLTKSLDDIIKKNEEFKKDQADRKAAAEQQERINDVIDSLKFERDQLGRTDREQLIYNSLKRAGIDASSKYGDVIRNIAGDLYDYQQRLADLNDAVERENALMVEGARVTESNQTAIESYNVQMARLRELVDAGAISQQTFARASVAAEAALASVQDEMWKSNSAMQKQIEDTTDWGGAASKAFDEYSTKAQNAAANSRRLASGGFSALEDALVSVTTKTESVKDAFTSMVDGILADFQRLLIRQSITGPLAKIASGAISSFVGGMFGGGGAGVDYSSPSYDWSQVGGGTTDMTSPSYDWSKFADGGVMTPNGPAPLRRYSAGGIATSRQVAEFGEGSVPEAFVPVPSGKIPVDLKLPKAAASSAASGSVFNIDARGADQGAIARLEQTIVAIGGVVKRIDTSFDKRAVGAVSGAVQRGGSAARAIRGKG